MESPNTVSAPLAIFDMDGTLTRPYLDFDRIRADIGLSTGPILEQIDAMPPGPAKDRALDILHRHEDAAAEASELQPFALDVLAAIRRAGRPIALMTRNTRKSTRIVCDKHGLAFDLVRTREDGPTKPSPEPILDICRALRARADEACMIGDFHFDIACGNAAGSTTVLLWERGVALPNWADEADHVIEDLRELLGILGIAGSA